ncbi:hypothetical protein ASG89_20080 [Paenibacillus sp. Soil766]|uniref:TnsA endonuclease C-terminal domain-containing protein n=1 Tax=Paenibacillus sp. Soil766 TaxID=1736404 RepID=UPI000709F123|nr:TnsA endonuclease C-terminal domain-containing protein [Paenibacillus sp. Soil766]KRF06044.1 hypothetical protein ASG89_20080 [Paenibacillus sp. Soil766]
MDYNWSTKKDWSKEDKLYSRKRNVTNKGSREFEHLIGSIYSYKMNRGVQYESFWGECLFYYLLELDRLTIRYYEQPVNVSKKRLTKEYILKEEVHVPDALTFRDGSRPILFQIKGGNSKVEQDPFLYTICENYAREQGWEYSLVNPKVTIPEIIKENILWLVNYLRPREYFSDLIPEVKRRVEYLHKVEVIRLAKSFEPKVDYRHVLPLIFHLIATGILITNINRKIDHTSEVSFGTIFDDINLLFEKE